MAGSRRKSCRGIGDPVRSLTVLNVAYPLAPVGLDAVGGAEQILNLVDRALMQAGHQSIVVACEGSSTHGLLIPVPRFDGKLDDAQREQVHRQCRQAIERAVADHRIDLIHMHGVDFLSCLPAPEIPVLVTLHLPPSWYPPETFRLERQATYLQCVSHSQLRDCPGDSRQIHVIENGVPVDRLQPIERNFGYAAALGRICPEKGFHLAAHAARKARIPLLIGGIVFGYDAHVRYFRESLEPLLDKHTCRYLGPVGFRYKRLLLAGARCLLVSSLVSETSSLAAMEALSCGTPVVAFKSGALKEIVEHGKTGFLVSDVDEMAEAIQASAALDRNACRNSAIERFSADRMTRQYIELYHQILNSNN